MLRSPCDGHIPDAQPKKRLRPRHSTKEWSPSPKLHHHSNRIPAQYQRIIVEKNCKAQTLFKSNFLGETKTGTQEETEVSNNYSCGNSKHCVPPDQISTNHHTKACSPQCLLPSASHLVFKGIYKGEEIQSEEKKKATKTNSDITLILEWSDQDFK